MPQPSIPTVTDVPVRQEPTLSAAAQDDQQTATSACQEDSEDALAVPPAPTGAILTSKTAQTEDVGPAPIRDLPLDDTSASIPRYHVQPLVPGSCEVYGVDFIIHNQYLGSDTDFYGMRKQYDGDNNAMILKVAGHVRDGLYTVISMTATEHMLALICAYEKMKVDLLADVWDELEVVVSMFHGVGWLLAKRVMRVLI